jgi:hypothetical protein
MHKATPLSRIAVPGMKDNKRIVNADKKFNKFTKGSKSDSESDGDEVFDKIMRDIPSLSGKFNNITEKRVDKRSKGNKVHKSHRSHSDSDESGSDSDEAKSESGSGSASGSGSESDPASDSESGSESGSDSEERKKENLLKHKRSIIHKGGYVKESNEMRVNNNLRNLLGESNKFYGDDEEDDVKTRINKIQTKQDIINRIEELKESLSDPKINEALPKINADTKDDVLIDTLNALEYKYESMNNVDIARTAADFSTGMLEDIFDGKRKVMGQTFNLTGISTKVSRHLNKRKLHVDFMVREIKKAYGIGAGMEFLLQFASMCYITNKENAESARQDEARRAKNAIKLASSNYLDNL